MTITKKENRIFFDNIFSHGNISIHERSIKIELIRVNDEYKGKGYASKLLETIVQYIQDNFQQKKIILSPMPISTGGKSDILLNLEQLIKFYKKYKFTESDEKTREEPYLMVRYL